MGPLSEWERQHGAARAGVVITPGVGAASPVGSVPYPASDEADPAAGNAWWSPYAPVVPGWQRRYLDLEPQASRLMCYEPCLVPELLQTADYARAAIAHLVPGVPKETLDALVELRMRRQELAKGAALWVLLEQDALSRRVGSLQIMQAQYRRLLSTYTTRTITVQVLSPQAATARAPYTILRFPGVETPDVAYLPHLDGPAASYLDDPADLADLVSRFSSVALRALSRVESSDHVRNLLLRR